MLSCFHRFLCTPTVYNFIPGAQNILCEIWCSTGHVKHVWGILSCCDSCFQFSAKDVLYGVTVYSFHVPTKQSTALKLGRCGLHTVGPPVDRICWSVGADHHAQTMYFLSPLMKHHPTTHANHFLMSMRASKFVAKPNFQSETWPKMSASTLATYTKWQNAIFSAYWWLMRTQITPSLVKAALTYKQN